MIKDRMKELTEESTLQAEARRPKPVFLLCAAVSSIGAVVAYFYKDTLVATDGYSDETGFAILVTALVLIAVFFVLCYRLPRIGNKLLGFGGILGSTEHRRSNQSIEYTGGFTSETGLETKQMNSRRKQARHSRKHLAQITREMQKEKQNADKG